MGASADPKKLGNVVFKNLITNRFKGVAYPVNLTGEKVYGKRAYKSVLDLPITPDLVVIVIPAAFVPEIIRQCGTKHIRAAIIISAGFSEIGEAGSKLEQSLERLSRGCHVRIMGPNCLGVIVPSLRMNASFAEGLPAKGSVAVVSQSGAMAVAITEWAIASGLGFSALISLGNKTDIFEEEIISHLAADSQTKVISMYLENMSTGRSLLRTIKKTTKKKPVIILLPGKSDQAKQAIVSHTGALAGSQAVHAACLRAAGAIVVDSLEQLFICTQLFSRTYPRVGSRVAILTNAGGPGILATDAVIASHQLNLANLSDETKKSLKVTLPPAASIHNPIDVVGDAPAQRYLHALGLVIADHHVDSVVCLLTHQYVTDTNKIAKGIIKLQKRFSRKPIIVSFIGGDGVESGRKLLAQNHITHFPFPEQAVWALQMLSLYETMKNSPRIFLETLPVPRGTPRILIGKNAESIIKKYIPNLLPSVLVKSTSEAIKQAKKIGFPLVVKVISKKIVHKTDQNAVRVNILSEQQLLEILSAWQRQLSPKFGLDEGFLLQPYQPGQLELIIGAKRDSVIGPYLLIGVGGIFTEAFKQVAISPIPINLAQALMMLQEGLIGDLIASPRGSLIPQKELAKIMVGLSKLMNEKSNITECDLNPVIIGNQRAWIADLRLVMIKR